MTRRPTADELIEAAVEFLETEVAPVLVDHRLKFRLRVALNALAIAGRDLDATTDEDENASRALAARIRAGDIPDDALATLKRQVAEELARSSPTYLERYGGTSVPNAVERSRSRCDHG